MRYQDIKRIAMRVCGVAIILLLLASSDIATFADSPSAQSVTIDNFSFTPMELTIPVGTQITWINKDDVPHTIVSVDHQFKSKALDTDESFSFTFQGPGTYEYFCSVHPKMTGKILVR